MQEDDRFRLDQFRKEYSAFAAQHSPCVDHFSLVARFALLKVKEAEGTLDPDEYAAAFYSKPALGFAGPPQLANMAYTGAYPGPFQQATMQVFGKLF